jgi:hypothetical protein
VPGNNANNENDEDEDDVEDDIEALIKKEVEGLKPKSSAPRLFQKITSNNMPCSKLIVPFLVFPLAEKKMTLTLCSGFLPD